MRGRPPKSATAKRLAGSPGKRKLQQVPTAVQPDLPECPSHLSAEAKAEWQRICAELGAVGLLKRTDRSALAVYCASWAQWVEAEGKLANQGRVLETDRGYRYANPWVGIANKALDNVRQFAIHFGLTPAARGRIALPEKPPEDPFEEFISKKK